MASMICSNDFNFKPILSIVPCEANRRIKNLIDKGEYDYYNSLKNDDHDYFWLFMGKKIMVWNNFASDLKSDGQFYELPIISSPERNINSFIIFKHKKNSRNFSAVFSSANGDFRYWPNIKSMSKFKEASLILKQNINILSLLYIESLGVVVISSDLSLYLLEFFEKYIQIIELSTRRFFPNIFNNIFAPFSTRTTQLFSFDKLILIDCNSDLTSTYKCVAVYDRTFFKFNQIATADSPYIKESREITVKELRDLIIKNMPNMNADMMFSTSILYLTYDKYIFIILANTASSNPIHTYIFLQLSITDNLTVDFKFAISLIYPSIEEFDKAIIKPLYDSLILVSLDTTLYIINTQTQSVHPVFSSAENAFPINISYSHKRKTCTVLFSNMKVYSTTFDNIEDTLNSTLVNSTFVTEIEASTNNSIIDNSIMNPLHWGDDCFNHFDLAFKKYINKQKELSFLMVSSPLSTTLLSSLIKQYSDIIVTSNNTNTSGLSHSNVFFVNESKSLERKLQWTCDMHEEFYKFLKVSSLWNRLWDCDQTKCCSDVAVMHVLRNREECKLCLLAYQASNNNDIFLNAISQLNETSNETMLDAVCHYTPQPNSIHNICLLLFNLEHNLLNDQAINYVENIAEIVTKFFMNILTIFNDTMNELGVVLKYLRKSKVEFIAYDPSITPWCLILDTSIISAYIKHITFYNDIVTRTSRPNHSFSSLSLSKKFLTILKIACEIVSNQKTSSEMIFNNAFNEILQSFEKYKYIDSAVDISTTLFNFDSTVKLCIEYNKLDVLQELKIKWKEFEFDKYICNWLGNKKKWKILIKEINAENIDEVISRIPELKWVYYLKQNQISHVKQSLSSLIDIETNLFYKKTYCSLYKLANIINPSGYDDPKNSYFTNLIKYQEFNQTSDNKKYLWKEYTNEEVLNIEYLIRSKLFESGLKITQELIMNSFNLLLQSQCDEFTFKNITTIIWSAVTLADNYIKDTNFVMSSTCETDSFVYKCFKQIINENLYSLLSPSLSHDVVTFLSTHLNETLSQAFCDKVIGVFEIAQDSFKINNQLIT